MYVLYCYITIVWTISIQWLKHYSRIIKWKVSSSESQLHWMCSWTEIDIKSNVLSWRNHFDVFHFFSIFSITFNNRFSRVIFLQLFVNIIRRTIKTTTSNEIVYDNPELSTLKTYYFFNNKQNYVIPWPNQPLWRVDLLTYVLLW